MIFIKYGGEFMVEDLKTIKKSIDEIKILIELSYKNKDIKNNKRLLDEFERLSYQYYKLAVLHMRDIEGEGDGI
jgi:hypothetical protein